MTPTDPVKLVSQLLDLPLIDRDGCYCGIVDDIELTSGAGKEAKLRALLVGPGAYPGRMPGWMMALVRLVAGDRVTRVPISDVEKISSAVHLNTPAASLGLHKSEHAAAAWIPKKGAM
jgi:sporulation protein YlmC with PRC-barrel domain